MPTASRKRYVTSDSAAHAGRWGLAVAIASSALAVGTVHTVTLCLVAAGLAIACTLAWWRAEPLSVRSAATVLLFAGVGLTAYTALQCVPLPMRILAVIAPHNADVWSRALSPLHEAGPGWAPISLDPIASRVEVLKGVTYLLAFAMALRLARRPEGARFLSAVIVLTGLVLAAAAVLHPAFGATKLFGVYEPGPGISERHIAPLMNPNNLAGYLNVAFCLALSAMFAPTPVVPRAFTGAIIVLLAATQIWIASRGGVVTMAVSVLLVAAIARIGHSKGPARGAIAMLSLVAGVAVAAGTAMIVLGASEEASSELFQTDASKLGMFWRVMRMLPSVPIFGCGRGAFESAFPAFRTQVGQVTFAYPENVVAQWTLEWGLPVAMGGMAAIVVALRPGAVLARSATASGAWAAIVALAVQNLGDLGSEIPGLALAATICAAIVVGGTPGHKPRRRVERWAKHPKRVAVAAAAAASVAITVATLGMNGQLHADQRALLDAAMTHPVTSARMHELERAAMSRHPAEPYLPFAAGLRASRAHDESPIPWIGATLERANLYASAHLILARVVAARSPSQARLEYRTTIEQAPELDVLVMGEAPRVVGGYDDAMELVPRGLEGARVLEMLVAAIFQRLPATRVRLDAEIAARTPADPGPMTRAAADAVEDVEASDGEAPWCEGGRRPSCVRAALDKAERARRMAQNECQPNALKARARIAAGDGAPAIKDLLAAADRASDRFSCLQSAEGIARGAGDEASADTALEEIVTAGCADDAECARQIGWVAAREESLGNRRKALTLYRRAYERAPEDDYLLECTARLAAESGLHAEAADDYERLAHKHPGESRYRVSSDAERQAALKAMVNL